MESKDGGEEEGEMEWGRERRKGGRTEGEGEGEEKRGRERRRGEGEGEGEVKERGGSGGEKGERRMVG